MGLIVVDSRTILFRGGAADAATFPGAVPNIIDVAEVLFGIRRRNGQAFSLRTASSPISTSPLVLRVIVGVEFPRRVSPRATRGRASPCALGSRYYQSLCYLLCSSELLNVA